MKHFDANNELGKIINYDYRKLRYLVYKYEFLKCLRDVLINDYTILSENDIKLLKHYIISYLSEFHRVAINNWWVDGMFSLSDDRLEILARSKLEYYKKVNK